MQVGQRRRYRTAGRALHLFREFLKEQTDPESFYTALARDTIELVSRHEPLAGRTIVDVGAGTPQFCREFVAAGARYLAVDPEREALAPVPGSFGVVGVGEELPLATGSADIVMANNVMEHVRDPGVVGNEMLRVVRPGGLVFISYTSWSSPWGGHETSPWHWVGGDYAKARYERRHGRPPKNRVGENMFPTRVDQGLDWARNHPDAWLVEAIPRYHPDWATWIITVPGLREVMAWNHTMVLRHK
ncbi:MAG TPA: class I SAM-dependent methyltransferase [Candidatus Nanopelagicales bacterium]|jgi:SAM-dependent methyltransferase|nr:class I SAM-dependent methyltransferase [Candidatus Nanopelagicales bacterium]